MGSWKEKDGSDTIYEVGCDDDNQQIRIYTIGINYDNRTLGSDETCSQACDGFLQARCQQGTRNQTATMCACRTETKDEDKNPVILEDFQRCDAEAKKVQVSETHKSTHPQTKSYNEGQTCYDTMKSWLEGLELSHPDSCSHPSLGDIVRGKLLV